jgi:hypothetical protein
MAKEFCTLTPGPNGWEVTFPGGSTRVCKSHHEAKDIVTMVNSWLGFQTIGIGTAQNSLDVSFLREWHGRLEAYGVQPYATEIKRAIDEAEGRMGAGQ